MAADTPYDAGIADMIQAQHETYKTVPFQEWPSHIMEQYDFVGPTEDALWYWLLNNRTMDLFKLMMTNPMAVIRSERPGLQDWHVKD